MQRIPARFLLILTITSFVLVLLLNVFFNGVLTSILSPFLSWLGHPSTELGQIRLGNSILGVFGLIVVIALGSLTLPLSGIAVENVFLKRVIAVGLGFGLVGFFTIILALLRILYFLPTIMMLLLWGILAVVVAMKRYNSWDLGFVQTYILESFQIWRPERKITWRAVIQLLPFCAIYTVILFQSLSLPIIFWDALFYHASIAKILFYDHSLPLIAGWSSGISMGGNYPPLFSSIGAFLYTLIGSTNETFFKIVPVIMSILAVSVTYLIGKTVFGALEGKLAAVLLALTPVFLYTSVDALFDTTLAFFLGASTLFLILGVKEDRGSSNYFLLSVLFYSFALLTSYRTLYYFFIPLAVLLAGFRKEPRLGIWKTKLSHIGLLAILIVVGGSWYLRNLIVFDNPFYPLFFGGKYVNTVLEQLSNVELQTTIYTYIFGTTHPSIFNWFRFLFLSNDYFPVATLLTLAGVAITFFYKRRGALILVVWGLLFYLLPVIPLAHERYIMMSIPSLAIFSALPLAYLISYARKRSRQLITACKLAVIFLMVLILISTTLPPLIAGKQYQLFNPPKPEPILAFTNPGIDTSSYYQVYYGNYTQVWSWINSNINGTRVAMPGLYPPFFQDSDIKWTFFLDSWEAYDLFNITDDSQMTQFFTQHDVGYIYMPIWTTKMPGYREMSFTRFLGSPQFPLVYQYGGETVFHVGQISDPLTDGSLVPVYINWQNPIAWSELYPLQGVSARDVLAYSVAPRLNVGNPLRQDHMSVEITYFDSKSNLTINLLSNGTWYLNYAFMKGTGSEAWKTFSFSVPPTSQSFTEFGLNADGDFAIAKIVARACLVNSGC